MMTTIMYVAGFHGRAKNTVFFAVFVNPHLLFGMASWTVVEGDGQAKRRHTKTGNTRFTS